ncbi:hypothetical protein ACS0TY_002587 [Phlomoides rotata]
MLARQTGLTRSQVVRGMIKHYDLVEVGIKARNEFDALHIATKQGDLEVVKVLLEVQPELSVTVDMANTTALHTAAEYHLVREICILMRVYVVIKCIVQ